VAQTGFYTSWMLFPFCFILLLLTIATKTELLL